jgi:nucleotide-binding universal stress UspA family protein
MKRILVAFDGSEGSQRAYDFALELARKFGADVLVLAVVRLPEPTTSLELDSILDLGTEQYNKDFEALLARASGVNVRTDTEVGHPAEKIVARAEHEHADLIVMGRRGRSAIGRWMLGSVSERVLRYAHCPVTVVK